MSISSILEIGRRSLFAQQSAINTTGRNIANVNTLGYTRQRIKLHDDLSSVSYLGKFGQDATEQIRQSFTDYQIWRENSTFGSFQTGHTMLSQIQDIFSEPTDAGIANLMTEYWNSWNDLANDPDNETAKIVVRDKGIQLANGFNRVHDELIQYQNQVNLEIGDKVTRINELLEQISELNQQIINTEDHSLKDTRALLVDELSEMVNINVAETASGELNIAISGMVVVSGQEVNKILYESEKNGNLWHGEILLESTNQTIDIQSGELKAMLELQNDDIKTMVDNLNLLANQFAKKINEVHYDPGGVRPMFFNAGMNPDDVTAGNIQINDLLFNDPSLVGHTSDSGDSSFALEMFNLQNESSVDGNSFSEFYSSIITQIGSGVNEAGYMKEAQGLVIEKLNIERLSVSGVSLDEEMTHMIQYEQAYNAAAKLISTVDDMITSIMNLV